MKRRDDHKGLPHWAAVIVKFLTHNNRRLEKIMDTVEDLNAKLDLLTTAQEERDAAQLEALARIAEDVAFLKSQVAAGVDLSGAMAKVETSIAQAQAATVALRSVDPVPENPAPGQFRSGR